MNWIAIALWSATCMLVGYVFNNLKGFSALDDLEEELATLRHQNATLRCEVQELEDRCAKLEETNDRKRKQLLEYQKAATQGG